MLMLAIFSSSLQVIDALENRPEVVFVTKGGESDEVYTSSVDCLSSVSRVFLLPLCQTRTVSDSASIADDFAPKHELSTYRCR